jgi:hypothetical protein
MADFKSEFFNLEKMRNTVLARVGEYLQLPAKIDAMQALVDRMTGPRAADFKVVLPSLKKRVNDMITASLLLKDQMFAFSDAVQKDPEVSKVIKGEVGLVEFAMTSLFKSKTDINSYKGYLATAVDLSKRATKMINNMEMLKAEIANVELGIKNANIANPLPPPSAEPKTWQTKGAMLVAGGVVAALAAHSWWKSRRN